MLEKRKKILSLHHYSLKRLSNQDSNPKSYDKLLQFLPNTFDYFLLNKYY